MTRQTICIEPVYNSCAAYMLRHADNTLRSLDSSHGGERREDVFQLRNAVCFLEEVLPAVDDNDARGRIAELAIDVEQFDGMRDSRGFSSYDQFATHRRGGLS